MGLPACAVVTSGLTYGRSSADPLRRSSLQTRSAPLQRLSRAKALPYRCRQSPNFRPKNCANLAVFPILEHGVQALGESRRKHLPHRSLIQSALSSFRPADCVNCGFPQSANTQVEELSHRSRDSHNFRPKNCANPAVFPIFEHAGTDPIT